MTQQQISERTPYRIVVCCRGEKSVGRGKRTRTVTTSYAYMGWTEVQHYNEARLSNAGSFLFPGLHAVRRAAMEYLAQPGVHQVSIRTNQDRTIYLFNKYADGKITGYRPDQEG